MFNKFDILYKSKDVILDLLDYMQSIICRKPGKVYFFDPGYIQLKLNDRVVVETSMGEDIGDVVIKNREIPDEKVSTPLKRSIWQQLKI